jgi:hypothetical protein
MESLNGTSKNPKSPKHEKVSKVLLYGTPDRPGKGKITFLHGEAESNSYNGKRKPLMELL